MPNYHINPNTEKVGKCSAEEGECPFKDANDETVPHFFNKQDAQDALAQQLMNKYNAIPPSKRKMHNRTIPTTDPNIVIRSGKKMTVEEAHRAEMFFGTVRKTVRERGSQGKLIKVKATQRDNERAQEAIELIVEHTDLRDNRIRANQIMNADVLPGRFEKPDGTRFNMTNVADHHTMKNHIEHQRELAEQAMTRVLRESSDLKLGQSFKITTESGTFSAKVVEEVNQEALSKLPKEKFDAIHTEGETIDAEKAKKVLNPGELNVISQRSQVLNVMLGSQRNVGQGGLLIKDQLEGNTSEEKMEAGLHQLSDIYKESEERFGKNYKTIKSDYAEMSEVVKSQADAHSEVTVIPAHSVANTGLVTSRRSYSLDLAKTYLSPEQVSQITKTTQRLNKSKAKEVLTDEEYAQVFGKMKLSITVREK